MVHKKSKRSSFGDISREWMLEGKREQVSRFTQQRVSQVGVVNILKSNMYSLQDGEPSVFEKETTSRALTAAANGEKPYRRGVVRTTCVEVLFLLSSPPRSSHLSKFLDPSASIATPLTCIAAQQFPSQHASLPLPCLFSFSLLSPHPS